jgi:diguanylate cyclase (GGDEF)-like protein
VSIPEQTPKILLIEDNSDDAILIEDMLEAAIGSHVPLTYVRYLRDGLRWLQQTNFDIILLDIRLPDSEDLKAIERIKEISPKIPIVVLTSLTDKETGLRAVRQGAQDFLHKGQFDCELLIRAIRYAIERQKHIERERLMGHMIERIYNSLDLREILNTTVQEVLQFLRTDRVLIYACLNHNAGRIAAESIAPKWKNQPHSKLEEAILFIQKTFSDTKQITIKEQELEQTLQSVIKTILTVPIFQNGADGVTYLWGQLIVHDYSLSRQWQPWEIEFLKHLGNSVAIAIKQSELYQTVERQARIDGLTGIANRRQFDYILEKEWQRLAKQKESKNISGLISLIICDVDFFKQYNDNLGYLAGDDCLKEVAQVMQKSSQRTSDLAARFGGEEFAIILPDTDSQGALKVAENIHKQLAEKQIPHPHSIANSYVTVSIGIATYNPTVGQESLILIDLANKALKKAKKTGRNQIVIITGV